VHGWLLSGRLWQPLVQRLESRWHLWTPDLPGFGTAPRPRGLQPSLVSYGRWLADAARERAEGRPLVLIGHSLGGSLALHASARLGDQLAGVVQVAAGGGVYQPRPFRMVRRGGAAFLRWRPGWLAQLPGTAAIRSPLQAELRAARGLLACSMQRGAVRRLPALVAALEVPSLWISGSRDTVMEPRYVRHLAGYSPEHRLELLEGEGHLPMRSAPERLAPLISDWLEELQLPDRREELTAVPGGETQSLARPRSWRSANCA
jgi:pimeloyl-ACP methyl ester carboxylesterase